MRVVLDTNVVSALMKDKERWKHIIGDLAWPRSVEVRITGKNIGDLEEICEKLDQNGMRSTLDRWKKISDSPGDRKVQKLQDLEDILAEYLAEKTPNGVIFCAAREGPMLPYVVTNVSYHPPSTYGPPYVQMEASYYLDGSVKSMSWKWGWEDRGGFAADYLDRRDITIPTDDLMAQYEEYKNRLVAVRTQVGKQFVADGSADVRTEYGGYRTVHLGDDGQPARLVIDTDLSEDKSVGATPIAESKIFGTVDVPLHPFVRCFDLRKHFTVNLHVGVLHEYVYNTDIRKHLVLPEQTSEILDILLADTKSEFKDIVEGKSGGVIVLARGPPGTGKTLTAEVCAEALERPLYIVQCAQLGLTHDKVEKNLETVLNRANRWGAILLIDEADVYIHHRGEDLEQNAIVGVFLRTLEYYSGVLFLTTNRATLVDDAIVSRLAASIEYGRPEKKDLAQIWRVLSNVAGISIDPDLPERYADTYPRTSGRDVKVLLKLASMRAKYKGRDVVEMGDVLAVLPFKPNVGEES